MNYIYHNAPLIEHILESHDSIFFLSKGLSCLKKNPPLLEKKACSKEVSSQSTRNVELIERLKARIAIRKKNLAPTNSLLSTAACTICKKAVDILQQYQEERLCPLCLNRTIKKMRIKDILN
ncbi:hypothetical protein DB41_CO00090 [Neochlamydia sp. TUME1]|uniref:hypothetical protein n=1 Tax=Neochlamydia sp. TUME1 TaxID=1478174 RepID=UPI00057D96F0|nr:hypothetical protein [Neochlamydia sp. TUME1]KIC77240.1 hypothetical protein DB41_CO00090 [Neochlamydia sp. TUME1]